MKKALMIVLAILISVAFVTTVLAQEKKAEKPAAATEKPAAATDKPVKEKAVEKAKKVKATSKKIAGEFVSMDEAAKTIVVKGETEMTFDVSKIKKMAKFAAGDKVTVVYKEMDGKNVAITVVKAAAAKKAKEKVEKAKEKKEAKPAAEKPAAPEKK